MNKDGGHHVFIWFDPGRAATGWAFMVVKRMAFSRPENMVLSNLDYWESGEYKGHEHEHCQNASWLVKKAVEDWGFLAVTAGTEDFDLVQTIGAKEDLLSPVRINAVLDWEIRKTGLKLKYQDRSLRTNQTKARLKLFGFNKRFGKDELSAMQHLVYYVRKVKEESKSRPWKLNEGDQINSYWDCACSDNINYQCDLRHPQ